MSGTVKGGIKARDKNIELYGKDFYKRIGKKGGQLGKTGGFYANRELARKAGRKGGLKSRRTTPYKSTVDWFVKGDMTPTIDLEDRDSLIKRWLRRI